MPAKKTSPVKSESQKFRIGFLKIIHIHKCLMNYRSLLTRVDRLLESIRGRYSGQIMCHKGCECGCRNLSIFPIEALSVFKAVQDLSEKTGAKIKQRAASASFWDCPLLEDRACCIYAFRPVICRTHGFALRTHYRGRSSIGYCHKNFKDMPSIPNDAVIDLDKINRTLRTLNESIVGELSHVLQLPGRLSISEAILLEANF